jgi:hypothetical protein
MIEHHDVDPNEICARGSVTAPDVAAMRRSYYAEGIVTEAEADAIFAINNSCKEQCPEWADLFVESLTDYLVHQAVPAGYVTAENASWLMARISVDNVVQSRTELELLVHIMEEARWVPGTLVTFALEQVRLAVVEGAGPLRPNQSAEPGVVTAAEVQLLRRILYASGSDGNIAITRSEAEVLFAINDACDENRNDPAWADLFAKAVACSVMCTSGYTAPSREAVLREEQWLEEDANVSGFLGRMVQGGLTSVWSAWRAQSPEELELERLERQRIALITDEAVSHPEADWISDRIGRDGRVTEAERSLLKFLKDESPSVHPSLQSLIDMAA